MLVDEKDIVLEASIEMGLETQLTNHWVVMAVDMRIDTVHSLEDLSDHAQR